MATFRCANPRNANHEGSFCRKGRRGPHSNLKLSIQASRPGPSKVVTLIATPPKGVTGSDNQFDPAVPSCGGTDEAATVALPVPSPVGPVGGNEVIIVEVDFSQQGIAVPASRPVSDEPISVAQAIIHSGALQSLQR